MQQNHFHILLRQYKQKTEIKQQTVLSRLNCYLFLMLSIETISKRGFQKFTIQKNNLKRV